MLEHHLAHKADITVAVTPVVAADAPSFGILKTDETQRITEFLREAEARRTSLAKRALSLRSWPAGASTWHRWAI